MLEVASTYLKCPNFSGWFEDGLLEKLIVLEESESIIVLCVVAYIDLLY